DDPVDRRVLALNLSQRHERQDPLREQPVYRGVLLAEMSEARMLLRRTYRRCGKDETSGPNEAIVGSLSWIKRRRAMESALLRDLRQSRLIQRVALMADQVVRLRTLQSEQRIFVRPSVGFGVHLWSRPQEGL